VNIKKLNKYLITTILFVSNLQANPINEIIYKFNDDIYNFFVEIPAGTKEKWEVNKKNGILNLEEKDGKKRIVKFLSYPGNYGFIPQTLSGDLDALDVIDLDETVQRGVVKKVKIIGALYFEDKKQIDIKIIAIGENSIFKQYNNLSDILLAKPSAIEIVKNWFLSYKKPGKMVFFRYLDRKEAIDYIEEAHTRWELKT
jgi:inorganic pyrophosphatase